MSYTVDVAATDMTGPGWPDPGAARVSLTTFAGGERGRMVQVTVGGRFACLTMGQLDDLIEVAKFARSQSLADHPRQGMTVES